ncbi:biotin transporter BioY [Oerskovia sp. M15]
MPPGTTPPALRSFRGPRRAHRPAPRPVGHRKPARALRAPSTSRWRISASDAARIATFAALTAVLGMPGSIALFGNAVPITLQTLGIMLAGALLGAWRGALAMLTFLALVAAGLPLLSAAAAAPRSSWVRRSAT